MAIFEGVPESNRRKSATNRHLPAIMGVVAGLAMVGFVVLGFVLSAPFAGRCFGAATMLAIYLSFTGRAFYVDYRRRRNYLLGR